MILIKFINNNGKERDPPASMRAANVAELTSHNRGDLILIKQYNLVYII
jgi:hypothetical protein